jgi:hypothetical protein
MLRIRGHRRASATLVAVVALASGCGDGEVGKPAAGTPLDTRGLADSCNQGENFDCAGARGPNAAPGPDGLVLVVWQGTYVPTEHPSWGRLVDAATRRPVGELLTLDLEEAQPGESLLISGDERGWTVQLRDSAIRVRADGTQGPARRVPGMGLDPAVKVIGQGCGGGAISVAIGGGAPLIISAGEDRRMRIDPRVCGL